MHLLRSFKADFGKEDDQLPSRLVVAPWGDNDTGEATPLRVNETTVKLLPRMQEVAGFDRVALDFSHNTVPGTEHYAGEPAKVAAYASVSVVPGEGIVYEDLEWTPEGRDYVGNKHYIDLSPAVKADKNGNIVFLHSAAVCRQGRIKGLSINSADPDEVIRALAAESPENPNTMDEKKLLLMLLGLPENASPEEIDTAAQSTAKILDTIRGTDTDEDDNPIEAMSARITDLEKKLKDAQAPVQEPEALKTLSAQVTDLAKKLEGSERDAILGKALREGKIIPNSANDLPVEKLRALAEELPADQVPLDRRTPEGVKSYSANAPDSVTEQIRKRLGISDDVWKKHNA